MKGFKLWILGVALALLIPVSAFGWAEPMTAVMKDTKGVVSGMTVWVIAEGDSGVSVFKVLPGGVAEATAGVSVLTTPGSHNYAVNLTKVLSEIAAGVSIISGTSIYYATIDSASLNSNATGATIYISGTPKFATNSSYVRLGTPVYINDTSDAFTTAGLAVNQGAADDAIITMKSSDVTHGYVTGGRSTNTFGDMYKPSPSTYGGLQINAIAEDSDNRPTLRLMSVGGTAHSFASNGTATVGLVDFYVAEHNGANSLSYIANDGAVFSVSVRKEVAGGAAQPTIYVLDEDGDSWQEGTLTGGSGFIAGYKTSYAASPAAGATGFFLASNSGTTPGAPTSGAMFFAQYGRPWTIASDGTVTQLGMHDPETGEPIFNSYNIYTGQGERINLRTMQREAYTVTKVNPELVAKEQYVIDLTQKSYGVAEIDPKDAFVDQAYEEKVATGVTEYVAVFSIDNGGKIIETTVAKMPTETVTLIKKVLKPDLRFNCDTGKITKKLYMTKEEAQIAADKNFVFDWKPFPKYVRDAWGK